MDQLDIKNALKAQQKLNKFMKAAKKEEHLSPSFQSMVREEKKQDEKESTNNLLAAVKTHGKAKEAVLEIEKSRMQLWSQWKLFLQQSVVKWKEYTEQFQQSEQAFHQQLQEATSHLRYAQRRVDMAKKKVDINESGTISISDDEMEEEIDLIDIDEEIPRDENAQKIQEGLHQVVSSLVELSESAEKLEPKLKRPRTKEEDSVDVGGGASKPSSAPPPFGRADAS